MAGIPNEGRLVPPTSRLTRLSVVTSVMDLPMNVLLATLFMKVWQDLVGYRASSLVRCLVPKLTLVISYFPVTSRSVSLQFKFSVSLAMTVTPPFAAAGTAALPVRP